MKKLLILFFCYFHNVHAQIVTTFAGSTQGTTDGIGSLAKFYGPAGLALAPDGNLYVADRVNHRIRKITPSGEVSTFAGNMQGFANGNGTAASFNSPMNLTIDNAGILYVADSNNHCIRKITPDATVTTIAGSINGFADGTTSSALFSYPEGIFVDVNGVLYIGDTGNQRIRKIMPNGTVTTLAGGTLGNNDGTGTSAQFWSPCGLTVDSSGTVYVAEKKNRIRKITSSGVVTTFVGNGTSGYLDGVGTAARLNTPFDITMDASGYLNVTDTSNNRIRKIMSDGTITTFAGSTNGYLDGVGTAARFNYPIGICASDDGMLYIGESGGNKIRKITTSLSFTPFNPEDIVNIYPNPSSQSIHVEFDNLSTVKIDITDGNGRLLKSLNNVVNQCVIDISEFANGIYFLQLQTDNDIIVKKILKK